jgi:hypothetical protein
VNVPHGKAGDTEDNDSSTRFRQLAHGNIIGEFEMERDFREGRGIASSSIAASIVSSSVVQALSSQRVRAERRGRSFQIPKSMALNSM